MPTTQTTKPRSSKSASGQKAQPVAEPRAATPTEPALNDAEKREALIRIAAYSFYERRGCVDGHELEDWLRAEMEVTRQALAGKEPTQPG
jgi:hypothetical protein